MQPTTVLLVRPETFYWTRLRATLREWPDLQIVEDVQQPEPGLRLAEKEQPDLIFMTSDQCRWPRFIGSPALLMRPKPVRYAA